MSMDMIGKRGEALFSVAITAFCSGRFWFEDTFLGAKAEALDFSVQLIGSSVFHANFYVQVKAIAKKKRYSGKGKRRRLLVTLEAADAKKLGAMKVPAYVVGIDIVSGRAYVKNVKAGATKGFTGISVRNRLNCNAIKIIWKEVEAFWQTRPQGMTSSAF
ncbi:MAG TPA: hypothetical protein VMG10_21525 [Gemmataceae bacterium]|nr:hypothetical protein [Gemmataceae bacterium]